MYTIGDFRVAFRLFQSESQCEAFHKQYNTYNTFILRGHYT